MYEQLDVLWHNIPVPAYPIKTETGPDVVKAPPIPTNKPVPMVPPSAMNCM